MAIWIAMLRGINVSGHKPVKMELLRASFDALGFNDVTTYVQSGNVVFQAPKISGSRLAEKIASKIEADFGFAVPVLLRTPDELAAVLAQNPFAGQAGLDESKLYVTFLSEPAPSAAGKILRGLAAPAEEVAARGREIFLYCPGGYGNTKVSNTAIERTLGVQATTRNWRTVNALRELANR